VGPADPNGLVELTVTIRGKKPMPEPSPASAPLTIEQIEDQFGADPSDVDLAAATFKDLGLSVTEASAGARTLKIEGTVATVEKVFSVSLGLYDSPTQAQYRGREGVIQIPSQLSGIVTGVFGLDERQVARRRPTMLRAKDQASGSATSLAPQVPADLESRYNFPPGTAAGQKIGILEFGGGYFASDLQMFCSQISKTPVPNVTTVAVGKKSLTLQQIEAIKNQQQRNSEFDASGEVNMDIQIVAGLCPGATILVYFAPFTQSGWINVLKKAIHDPSGPKVISVSWGAPEDTGDFTASAIQEIDNALKVAALAGVTVCISSGDDGAGDAANDGNAHLDFPASSPNALAVGGTMILPTGEIGWWEAPGARTQTGGGSTGGGRSTVFPTPSWQNVPVVSVRTGLAQGRCIPDVAALSGEPLYALIFDGQSQPNGGTSASAPLWTSLLARIAANLPAGKQVGFLTPKLYANGPNGKPLGHAVTTDITSGHNDVVAGNGLVAVTGYQSSAGYDAITGWGVPNGVVLQTALS
jgi:kumamolisin